MWIDSLHELSVSVLKVVYFDYGKIGHVFEQYTQPKMKKLSLSLSWNGKPHLSHGCINEVTGLINGILNITKVAATDRKQMRTEAQDENTIKAYPSTVLKP